MCCSLTVGWGVRRMWDLYGQIGWLCGLYISQHTHTHTHWHTYTHTVQITMIMKCVVHPELTWTLVLEDSIAIDSAFVPRYVITVNMESTPPAAQWEPPPPPHHCYITHLHNYYNHAYHNQPVSLSKRKKRKIKHGTLGYRVQGRFKVTGIACMSDVQLCVGEAS